MRKRRRVATARNGAWKAAAVGASVGPATIPLGRKSFAPGAPSMRFEAVPPGLTSRRLAGRNSLNEPSDAAARNAGPEALYAGGFVRRGGGLGNQMGRRGMFCGCRKPEKAAASADIVAFPLQIHRSPGPFGGEAFAVHSSGSPAFRTPSNTAGQFGMCSIIDLTVNFGFRRRASAKAAFASSILPASA